MSLAVSRGGVITLQPSNSFPLGLIEGGWTLIYYTVRCWRQQKKKRKQEIKKE